MAFLTPALLGGLLLVAVPIALHLARRKQPIREVFPALRLLKRNRHRNEARLRLRRWVLLALRCAVIALFALALARPILRPPAAPGVEADQGPAGEGLAVALVFDNGENALYESGNRSRLELARESGLWLLEQLPPDAWVAIADRGLGGRAAEGDPTSASLRVERLKTSAATRPLGATVRDALGRLAEAPAAKREAYVFTDLSEGAWDEATRSAINAALDRTPGVVLRLMDIGAAAPRNAGLASLELSGESLSVGESLRIEAAIAAVGDWNKPISAQLWIDTPRGPVKRDERPVEITEGGNATTRFSVEGLEEGSHTGFVRLSSSDALPSDDVRYFGVEVREPARLLLTADSEDAAIFFRSAVAPEGGSSGAAPPYECQVVPHGGIASGNLADAEAVILLDPPPLSGRGGWRALYDYVANGGALGVFLGREANLDAFNAPDAQSLLPAPLKWRSRTVTTLRPASYSHPAIRPLAPFAEAIPWSAFPVYQHWELGSLREGATVVARFANGDAAIVEQAVGRGRVLMMTTPASDRLNDTDAWNELTGEDPWPFIALANAMTDYLVGGDKSPMNYTSGEPVVASLPAGLESNGFVLTTPEGEAVRQTIPPGANSLSIPSATAPGAYRVQAGGSRALLDRRFVVNLDPQVGRLARVAQDELIESVGVDRVEVLSTREQLAATIDLGRVGRELYAWVLPMMAIAFAAEQLISNRFYKEKRE